MSSRFANLWSMKHYYAISTKLSRQMLTQFDVFARAILRLVYQQEILYYFIFSLVEKHTHNTNQTESNQFYAFNYRSWQGIYTGNTAYGQKCRIFIQIFPFRCNAETRATTTLLIEMHTQIAHWYSLTQAENEKPIETLTGNLKLFVSTPHTHIHTFLY